MIRKNFHLAESQLRKLARMSEETGLSMAELTRRAIDFLDIEWNQKRKEKGGPPMKQN